MEDAPTGTGTRLRRDGSRRRVRPGPWADTAAYIADDASEIVEVSERGERIQIVDDQDAADIRVRVSGMSAEAGRAAARRLAHATGRLELRQRQEQDR